MCIHTWERTWQYIKKAGTLILAISILLWAAMTFPQPPADQGAVTPREALRYSVAGRLGTWMEPITSIAGFDWRSNIALIGGFAAKEVIVSSLATAYSLSGDEEAASRGLQERIEQEPGWTLPRGLAHIVFILLYSPCFATVAVIKKESGSWGWAGFSMVFHTALAFLLAVLLFQIGACWGSAPQRARVFPDRQNNPGEGLVNKPLPRINIPDFHLDFSGFDPSSFPGTPYKCRRDTCGGRSGQSRAFPQAYPEVFLWSRPPPQYSCRSVHI